MDSKGQEAIALHRWAVIAEAAGDRLAPGERGALVRQIAARAHTYPDGSARRYSRGTIDRWLRAWRAGVPHTTARGWVRRFGARAGELGVAFAALAVDLGGEAICPPAGAGRFALTAIGAAFGAAAGLPGWRVVGRWRFASSVSGGRLIAASITSPFLVVGSRRFMPPVPPLPA